MTSKKSTPTVRDHVTPTVITSETTFDDLFETKMLLVPIPVFVGLLPSLDNKEYLLPNVNHHFTNDSSSFDSLDSAFKKWVKEGRDGKVSIEFNAILMNEKHKEPKDDDLVAFNMFGASSKSLNKKMFGEVEWDCHHVVRKEFIENISSYDYDEYYQDRTLNDLKTSIESIFHTGSYTEGHYFLGFTDGLHRTMSLWKLVSSLDENDFREFILMNTRKVVVHVSYLKKDIRINHQYLPELRAIIQNQSGFIMQSKQQSIGHTLFDCYHSFALNSQATMKFLSILDCVDARNRKNISLIHAKINGDIFKDDPLTTVLQNLFLQFMLNKDFARLCVLKWKPQEEVIFWDRNAVEQYFPRALDQNILFPILFQTLPFKHASHAIQYHDLRIKSRQSGNFDLPFHCAMLFSLCRLFIFSPQMTDSILSAMDSMQKSSILTQYRLSFIQSVAYDASDFLVKYFTKNFSSGSQLHANWMIRYVLRCNLERQLLLLHQSLLGTTALLPFKDKFELSDCESEAIKNLHQREGNTEEDDRTNSTMIADKLVFVYARYLVLLLSLDSVHVQSLPILNTLLCTDKSELTLSLEVYAQREKDVDEYHKSCMIGMKIILGRKKLDLGPEHFVNSLLEKSQTSDSKLDPRALILDWLEEVNSDEVEESTQVRYHRDTKRSSNLRFNNFSDVVGFVKKNNKKLMCWFSSKKAEKKKSTEEHTDPPSKKHGTEAPATQAAVDKDIAEEKTVEDQDSRKEDPNKKCANDNSPNEDAEKRAAVDEDVREEKMMEDHSQKETTSSCKEPMTSRVRERAQKLPLHNKMSQLLRSTEEHTDPPSKKHGTEAPATQAAVDKDIAEEKTVEDQDSRKEDPNKKCANDNSPNEDAEKRAAVDEDVREEKMMEDHSQKETTSSCKEPMTSRVRERAQKSPLQNKMSTPEKSNQNVGGKKPNKKRKVSFTVRPGPSKEIDSSLHKKRKESTTDEPDPSKVDIQGTVEKDDREESSTDKPGPSAEENIQVDLNLWNEFVDTISDDKIKTILKNPDKECCRNWYNVSNLTVAGEDFLKYFQKVARSKKGRNQEQLIRDELYKSHIEYINVKGDGNCFFRCIAYQLEGDEEKHFSWRIVLCDWMSFLEKKGKINQNLGFDDSIIKELGQDGYHVNDWGISFLSRLLQRHIIILSEADSYNVLNGTPHVEKLDGKERRSLYLVCTDAEAERKKNSKTYKREMEAAKKKSNGLAVAELLRKAEQNNHYITFVPQYKAESPLPANINDIIPPIIYSRFETWFEVICNNPDPTKWSKKEKESMDEIKKQLKEYASESVSDA